VACSLNPMLLGRTLKTLRWLLRAGVLQSLGPVFFFVNAKGAGSKLTWARKLNVVNWHITCQVNDGPKMAIQRICQGAKVIEDKGLYASGG